MIDRLTFRGGLMMLSPIMVLFIGSPSPASAESSASGVDARCFRRLLLERIRLELATRFWDRETFFIQLQDAHALLTRFGPSDFPQSSPIEDALDIRQLYLECLKVGGAPLGFRLGRQQISYGDQRVFGPGSWGNTGRFAWDAALLKIDTAWFWTDLWAGTYLRYESNEWPDRHVDDFLIAVDYTEIKRLPFRLERFYVLKHDCSGVVVGEKGTGNLSSHTLGFQAERPASSDGLDASATFAAQFGRYGADALRAFGANGKLGITVPLAWRPRWGGQFTWGSGDKDPNDGVHGALDGVYGGQDIFFYGYLNLFSWANLRDSEVDLSVKPSPEFASYVEYHRFRLDRATDAWYTTALKAYRRDSTGRSGTDLGKEIDIRAATTLSSHLEQMAGCGRFFPTTFVKNTGTAALATWVFFQVSYAL